MAKKEIIIGLLVGLLANALGLFIAATILGNGDDFITVIKAAESDGFLGKLISLGALLNLGAFFFFIKKKQDFRARGVLIFTLLVVLWSAFRLITKI